METTIDNHRQQKTEAVDALAKYVNDAAEKARQVVLSTRALQEAALAA